MCDISVLIPGLHPPNIPPKPPSKRLYDLPMTRYSTSIFFLDHDVICGSPLRFFHTNCVKNGFSGHFRRFCPVW